MELFRTQIPVASHTQKISYHSPVMFIGSCFSENIGNKVAEAKFSTDNNPFGIVYNPLSVKLVLSRLIEHKPYTTDELFNYEGVWSSFDHHSRFSDVGAATCLQKINERFEHSSQFLSKAGFLFITFGTSYVYSKKQDGNIVANCHKLPASNFDRKRLTVTEIVADYHILLEQLYRVNPHLNIIFTVSPVRHWKDGAHENQLSKAILLLAIDQIVKDFPHTSYFPSYEIIMDDLRDYRFYEEDMLHPNKVAINYIWDRFKDVFMDGDTLNLMKEVEKVVSACSHRPFNPQTVQYKTFVKQTLNKIKLLQDQYPISFSQEEAHLLSLLQ
ncbi:MAG TPA: GSCFA domain-containing protein [Bacteroidales bacterium]|nr:GSCFA domain-containing protein [Bacteroidales bacterium]